LYPIYHARGEIFANLPLRVDLGPASVHFWDPMKNRVNSTAADALTSAATLRVQGMTVIMMTITTTRMRGVSG